MLNGDGHNQWQNRKPRTLSRVRERSPVSPQLSKEDGRHSKGRAQVRPGPAESGPLAALPCVVLLIQVSLSQVPVTFPRSHRRPPDPQVSYPPVPAHLLVGNGGTPREG